jgi:NADPH:quinone reductase-like Zn-dependent oxidoreductase
MGRSLWAMLLSLFVRQRFAMMMAKEHHESLERVAALVQEGQLRAVVDHTVELFQVADAIADLEAGKVRGKVAVRIA